MRILVVEDDAGIASGLRTNLQQRGYAVDLCNGVASAWSALRAERFDAVLLDLGLADGDGSELLRRLRLSAVAATGTASMGQSLLATERLRMANEASIRENIKTFLTRFRARAR